MINLEFYLLFKEKDESIKEYNLFLFNQIFKLQTNQYILENNKIENARFLKKHFEDDLINIKKQNDVNEAIFPHKRSEIMKYYLELQKYKDKKPNKQFINIKQMEINEKLSCINKSLISIISGINKSLNNNYFIQD